MIDQLALTEIAPETTAAAQPSGSPEREGEPDTPAAASAPRSLYTPREQALASVIAGFRWGGDRTWSTLKRSQRTGALEAASIALAHVEKFPD